MPGRALGWPGSPSIAVRTRSDVKLDAPQLTRPRQSMTLPIHLAGLALAKKRTVTVSAVDIGILQSDRVQDAGPKRLFLRAAEAAVEIRDLWGMLIDGMQGEAGAIHTGGDSSGGVEGNLPTQEPLALFSGVVKVDDQGNASVSSICRRFNGSVRLTAVAWSKDKVGSTQADVTVRDSVVVAATLAALPQCRRPLGNACRHRQCRGDAGRVKLDLDISRAADRRRGRDDKVRAP